MKIIDLHIHTVSTKKDVYFEFDMISLKKYVEIQNIDVLAITNHNMFDKEQFIDIQKNLRIDVFPGVEVDLLSGHMLVIAPNDEKSIDFFDNQCRELQELLNDKEFIRTDEFRRIFTNYKDYLLIPHYDKNPKIPRSVLEEFQEDIVCGEVTGHKKFFLRRKNNKNLTPVIFSDFRAKTGISDKEIEYNVSKTYLNIDEVSIDKLKLALSESENVHLSLGQQEESFELNSDGLIAQKGINLIFGKRASGKSVLLKSIYRSHSDSAKYIPQFYITNKSEDSRFNEHVTTQHSQISTDILSPLHDIIKIILDIDLRNEKQMLNTFASSLLKRADDLYLENEYSQCKIFDSKKFNITNNDEITSLKSLLEALQLVIDNTSYHELIRQYVEISNLKKLFIKLYKNYINVSMTLEMKKRSNIIIEKIISALDKETSVDRIADIDFINLLQNSLFVNKFNKKILAYQDIYLITNADKKIHDFRIRAILRPFENISEVKKTAGISNSLAINNIYKNCYKTNPYNYVRRLKEKGVEEEKIVNSIFKVDFSVLDNDGYELSGGQRAEYVLLDIIDQAHKYELLLIDEPEASFDNKFLKDKVIPLLKSISEKTPVFISTHNPTLGVLSKPNQLLYTRREEKENFVIYTGKLTSSNLTSLNDKKNTIPTYKALTELMEAGIISYEERGEIYEALKNN